MRPVSVPSCHTEHSLLVLLGQYAQQVGLVQALMAVPLHQKVRRHTPQSKVLEFLVAILAGLPHLEDISRDARPLDQDQAVAWAWGQASWADYSGVARTLQRLTWDEAELIGQAVRRISQPLIDAEVSRALTGEGRLVYDGDLTGRPVSNTSQSYPGAAFGHMDDEVRLGYQAAVVSLRSPSYRRLWLSVKPHPGNVLSCQVAEELVLAAESATGVRPWRRTDLLEQRMRTVSQQCQQAEVRLQQGRQVLTQSQALLGMRNERVAQAEAVLVALLAAGNGSVASQPYSRVAKARARLAACQGRCQRQQQRVLQAQRRTDGLLAAVTHLQAQEQHLGQRLAQFERHNAMNAAPIQAVFRLDAGFGTWENVALLIELGYEVYTRPYSAKVTASLLRQTDSTTVWTRVGDNAEMTAWSGWCAKGCIYPVDVGLERFYTGRSEQYGALLHFGTDAVSAALPAWFAFYNSRQTIEAGIKEGKQVFQMHHLKVRSQPALWLQEQLAVFAANFMRWAGAWLSQHSYQLPAGWLTPVAASIKTLVQVAAHTPASLEWLDNGCLLRFSDQSLYAGRLIQIGGYAIQLSLPFYASANSEPISMDPALIAQNLR